jgi:hypothetical protein
MGGIAQLVLGIQHGMIRRKNRPVLLAVHQAMVAHRRNKFNSPLMRSSKAS